MNMMTPRSPEVGFLGSTSFSAVYEEGFNSLAHDYRNGDISSSHDRLYQPNRDSQIRRGMTCLSLVSDLPKFEPLLRMWKTTKAAEHASMTSLIEPIQTSIRQTLYKELIDVSEHDRESLLFQQSSRIWQNSLKDMELPDNCSIGEYIHIISDSSHLRWVSLGLFFATVGLAALYAKGLASRVVFEEHRRLAKGMLEASDICISFCEELGHLSDAETWLYSENIHLASIVEGDASFMLWRRLGDLVSACIAKGLHMEIEVTESVPFWLSEMRKRTFSVAYIMDKAISSFTGRPPRLLRKYSAMQLPLDIQARHLYMPQAQLEQELERLDEHGWNTEEELRINIYSRTQLICSMIQEDILEFALASLPHNNIAVAEEILRRSQSAWSSMPAWITNMPNDQRRSFEDRDVATEIALNFKYNEFLLHRAIAKRSPSTKVHEELLRLSGEVLTTVMNNIDNTQAAGLYNCCMPWSLAKYALPTAGVLGLELLRQLHSDHISAKSSFFNRSKVIQNLSNLVATLGSVLPLDGDYQICNQARRALQLILDRVLNSQPPTPESLRRENSTIETVSPVTKSESWLGQMWSEPDFWSSLPTHPLFLTGRS